MALPSSGQISIGGSDTGSINYEFGRSNNATTAMSELYRGGSIVSANNANVPLSGAISLDNFHGAFQTGFALYTTSSGNFTVPGGVTSITYTIVGGGGGGGGGYTASGVDYGYGYPAVGGGAGSGGYKTGKVTVTPGQVIAYSVGSGGPNSGVGFGGWNGQDGTATTFGANTAGGGQKGTYHNEGGGGGNQTNVTNQGAAGSPGGNAGQWATNGPGGAGFVVNGTTYGTGGNGGRGLWTAPNGGVGTGGVVYITWP
jgi:hypothetical protein